MKYKNHESKPLGKVYVPSSGLDGAKILIVGEAPGFEEEQDKLPFSGKSGELLWNVLGKHGINRDQIKVTNLCHYRPSNNKFQYLLQTKELTDGISELITYVKKNPPNVILALGKYPLLYLTGKSGITNYRGSILPCLFAPDVKVIATYHPSYILRSPLDYPSFIADIERLVSDSKFKEFNLPKRTYHYNKMGEELESLVKEFENAPYLSVDIESIRDSSKLLCVGFAKDKDTALCISFNSMQAEHSIRRLLTSSAGKIFHNGGIFDIEMLHLNGYKVENFVYDTMIAQKIMFPELPASLAYLTSLYTREPYYKDEGGKSTSEEGKSDSDTKSWSDKIDRERLYIYNCKDVCVTYEIFEAQRLELSTDKNYQSIFDFEMEQLEVASSISRAGLFIDKNRHEKMKNSLLLQWLQSQQLLNKKVGDNINAQSPVQVKKLLYTKLKLPERKVFQNGTSRVTANEDALVASIGFAKDKSNERITQESKDKWNGIIDIIKLILKIRETRKLLSSYIFINFSHDGRIRSSFRPLGAGTGRWAASKYVDGTGVNAQTFPREEVELIDTDIKLTEEMIKSITSIEMEDEDGEE